MITFEGEYLNGKRNAKGKCYNNGILVFEGEYLYGYKLRGKIYYNEKLHYEGEFLFNKKWNGKGYDENGNIIYELINGKLKENYYGKNIIFKDKYSEKNNNRGFIWFEGECLKGKRNGKGKEYDFNGKLLFDDEYLNGERWNGIVREYNHGKTYFEN